MADTPAPTHIAYAKKQLTKRFFVWLEVGKGRLEADGTFHGILDRLPIGGFNGYTQYVPIGKEPPTAEPQRPQDEHESD